MGTFEKFLRIRSRGIVDCRIAPAVNEISSLSSRSTGGGGGFGSGGAMVDDPNFIGHIRAKNDLIPYRVVFNSTNVKGVCRGAGEEVDVNLARVGCHGSEVREAGVDVLYEMIA